jgi:CheY-like chemotaxis protein
MPTVLVVDDEFVIADLLETILTDEGYQVRTACNGKQALAKMAEATPDLIVLDFMMPILDGAGMLRAMATAPAYRHIPVIMISSLSEEVIGQKCAGYTAFLRKPFRVAAVLGTVARVLGDGTKQMLVAS